MYWKMLGTPAWAKRIRLAAQRLLGQDKDTARVSRPMKHIWQCKVSAWRQATMLGAAAEARYDRPGGQMLAGQELDSGCESSRRINVSMQVLRET